MTAMVEGASIDKLEIRSKEKEEGAEVGGGQVAKVLTPLLKVIDSEGKSEAIELPEVRQIKTDKKKNGSVVPYGPDRAKAWKMASEWVQELVIDENPVIQERRFQNRVKAESSYLYNEESQELYEWQEDEETLKTIRPDYNHLKKTLVDRVGKPTRSDFAELYPHKYDDPGLSEQARRTVRDLKAVFGSEILLRQ